MSLRISLRFICKYMIETRHIRKVQESTSGYFWTVLFISVTRLPLHRHGLTHIRRCTRVCSGSPPLRTFLLVLSRARASLGILNLTGLPGVAQPWRLLPLVIAVDVRCVSTFSLFSIFVSRSHAPLHLLPFPFYPYSSLLYRSFINFVHKILSPIDDHLVKPFPVVLYDISDHKRHEGNFISAKDATERIRSRR